MYGISGHASVRYDILGVCVVWYRMVCFDDTGGDDVIVASL